jgi:hypothetical protein
MVIGCIYEDILELLLTDERSLPYLAYQLHTHPKYNFNKTWEIINISGMSM